MAIGPDQRHPVKAGAFRATARAASGLDWLSPARQWLGKQIRRNRGDPAEILWERCNLTDLFRWSV
jgi:hypothetical protein